MSFSYARKIHKPWVIIPSVWSEAGRFMYWTLGVRAAWWLAGVSKMEVCCSGKLIRKTA